MKALVELPEKLRRAATASATAQGQTLRQFVAAAVQEWVRAKPAVRRGRPWMKLAGALKDYPKELDQINRVIEEEFGKVNPDDWK